MDEINQLKMFTLQEANELLPDLAVLIKKIQIKKREITSLEVEVDALELVNPSYEGTASPLVEKQLTQYEEAVNSFYAIIDEIHQTGALLKDIHVGLVDFYSVYQGRVVYLCWKLGEERIAAWHDIGKGFACRQSFEQENKAD